jgi:outer membrane protein assembly factor BamB
MANPEPRPAVMKAWLSWMSRRTRPAMALWVALLSISTGVLLTGGCRKNHPPERPTLSGPAYVWPGDTASFTVSTTDQDDDVISYMFSWGDTNSVEWSPCYVSGQSVIRTHVYPDSGGYCVRVKARDSKAAESEWSDSLLVSVGPVPPNVPTRPWGAGQWLRNYPFPCTTVTTDPESSWVAYQFDWGDGVQSGWSQFMPSGFAYSDTHSYAQGGSYSIRARATNGNLVSGWSEQFPLTVSSDTPPSAPLVPGQPKAPTQWLRNLAMACTTSTTDPSGVQVSYQFDWGDGAKSQWSQFVNGGVSFADTHSYAELGPFDIRARAKNSKKASGWSEPLSITVTPGEGSVAWSIGFTDPEDPEDSSDFSSNSFALGPDNTAYVACDYGALIARKTSGSTWKFILPHLDAFHAAPVLADDGTIYIGCSNDTIYALNYNGTVKWRAYATGHVNATGALGVDGTAYFQTKDSMVVAVRPDGSQLWSFPSHGGNSAPVVGLDGTVYVGNHEGSVYAIDPSQGTPKWGPYNLGTAPIIAPPAIDPSRNALYVANDDGLLQSIDLGGTGNWSYNAGAEPSGPVVGPDGSIYIGGGGKLSKLDPDGQTKWVFVPPMSGVVSTPAITVDGYVYVLVVQGKKKLALQVADSLYAVNPDGTRRWACGLGKGMFDPDYPLSAPKVDANGFIYVGDGYRAWCVVGISAPAQSAWPMFQHDVQNSGRAR